jgi:hypothetical protein
MRFRTSGAGARSRLVTAEHSARRINTRLRTVLDWATAQAHEQYRIQVLTAIDP